MFTSLVAACCLAILPGGVPLRDCFDDALPPGATARLGTIRWRLDGSVTSVAFPPDGKTVIAAGDGTVRQWELATGRELRCLVCRPTERSDVRLLPDGKRLVVTDGDMFGDAVIRLWDLEEWKELHKWVRPKEPAYGSFVLSPDGKTLAVSTDKGATVLRESRTEEERCRLEKPSMTHTVFSLDGKTIASDAGADIQLWDAETGRKVRLLRGHDDVHWGGVSCGNPITWIAFSPDGKKMVSASIDCSVIVWDVAAGKELHRLDELVRGKVVIGQPVLFTADGATLAVPGDDRVYLCDAAGGRLLREVRTGRGTLLSFGPDGKTLVLGGDVLRMVDLATGKDLLPAFGGHEADLRLLRFLPDGKTILTAGYDDTVRLWDAAGRQLQRFETKSAGMGAALSPDGRVLALAGWKGDVNLWDVTNGERLRGWQADARVLDDMAFSSDGKTLATGGLDQRMHLWDVETGAEIWRTEDQGMGIYQIAFSPDGRRAAAVAGRMSDGAGGRVVHLFDAAAGKEVGKFEGPHEKIYHLAFSPDGKTLAAASYHEPIWLWETATGGVRARLLAADDSADDLAFSPDGRCLAVAQYTRPTRLLDVLSGREVGAYDGGRGGASHMAISPDGQSVATSDGTSALIWPLTGSAAAARLSESDELSDDQRETAWEDLANADAGRAYLSMRALADDPGRSPLFLQERLEEKPDAVRRMNRLIVVLDSDDFEEREQAEAELRRMGRSAEAALRQTLRISRSAEVRLRAERLAQRLKPEDALSPTALRGSRALEALERMGDGHARQTLEVLAARAESSLVREEANVCLKRLRRIAP